MNGGGYGDNIVTLIIVWGDSALTVHKVKQNHHHWNHFLQSRAIREGTVKDSYNWPYSATKDYHFPKHSSPEWS